jgi:hypothetical protein
MNKAIEYISMNIPVKASHPSVGKFIDAMINAPSSLLEIAN